MEDRVLEGGLARAVHVLIGTNGPLYARALLSSESIKFHVVCNGSSVDQSKARVI